MPLFVAVFLASICASTALPLWQYTVITSTHSSTTDGAAASMLANIMSTACGRPVSHRVVPSWNDSSPAVFVGFEAVSAFAPHLTHFLDGLGEEGYYAAPLQTGSHSGVVAGAKTTIRGTLYGVVDFAVLTFGFEAWAVDQVDVAPWNVQSNVFTSAIRYIPPLSFRDSDYYPFGYHGDAKAVLYSLATHDNGAQFQDLNLTRPGGAISYANPPGAVHTSSHIVPFSLFGETHPEWFTEGATAQDFKQLCWGNDSLVEYMISAVRGFLRKSPGAKIISVSQNDNFDLCTRPADRKIITAEGAPSGPLLRAVNRIATALKEEFPDVLFSTLAYQYTRKPPKITRPASNVIIRLCDIEADFARPLNDPDSPDNVSFMADLRTWSTLTDRLYIWNYVTNFANFVQPWPDYLTIADNVRVFVNHSVIGLFQEGNYVSLGGDLSDLKSFVIGKTLWNPTADTVLEASKFSSVYYPAATAHVVMEYLVDSVTRIRKSNFSMTIDVPPTSAYLTPEYLLTYANQFTAAIQGDCGATMLGDMPRVPRATSAEARIPLSGYGPPTKKTLCIRARGALLPIEYVVLLRWHEVQEYASSHGIHWPFAATALDQFASFSAAFQSLGGTFLSEGHHTLDWLKGLLH